MSSGMDEFLNEVDRWKYKAHDQLMNLTAKDRKALWTRIGKKARAMGLHVIELAKAPKRTAKRTRRTG